MRVVMSIAVLAAMGTGALAQQTPKVPTGIDVPGPTCLYEDPVTKQLKPTPCDTLRMLQAAINNSSLPQGRIRGQGGE